MRPSSRTAFLCGVRSRCYSRFGGAVRRSRRRAEGIAEPGTDPKPASKFNMKIETYTSGTNQQFVGRERYRSRHPRLPPAARLRRECRTTMFSGRPAVTGEGISQDFMLTPSYAITRNIDVSATIGYGSASGTGNVVNYWGDAIMPSINANLGNRAYTLMPAFPTHNGQDPISATKLGFLSGSITDHNGNGGLTVGWFNLHQSVPWAFSQPPWVNPPFQTRAAAAGFARRRRAVDRRSQRRTDALPALRRGTVVQERIATSNSRLRHCLSLERARAHLAGTFVIDHGDGLKYSGG